MSSVDERIVSMKIDNKQLLSGVKTTQSALGTLNKTVNNVGNTKGMSTLGTAADGVKQKFSLMNAAALTAVATITNKVVNAGLHMAKSLTLDPIMQGFHEYETNLNSIQTIMANTGAKVGVVNKYLNDLNHYSDATIYSFSTMADSIGKFTAAGVPLAAATTSIKGMANAAALGGSNVQQLNTAMIQVSQALAAGSIKLQDWNSINTAGMGGTNMQKAYKATAHSLGDVGHQMDMSIKKAGNFRESLKAGWLTSKVFNKAMKVMAGTTNDAGKTVAYSVQQLQKMGYDKSAAKTLHRLSQAAIDSATKIKTFTQLIDVVKESIGSGWAKIFQDLMGNFDESTKLWTSVGTKITGVVSTIFGAVDKMLVGWRKLGGFQTLWNGFGNIFKALGNLIRPFVAGFQALLPTTKHAGAGLFALTSGFEKVTAWIEKATRGAGSLTPIMQALAGVFKIAWSVLVGVVHYFSALVPLLSGLAGGIVTLVGSAADLVTSFLAWADLGPKIQAFFDHFVDSRQKVFGPILDTVGAIIAAFGLLLHGDISGFKNQFKEALTNLAPLGDMLSSVAGKAQAGFAKLGEKGSGVFSKIAQALSVAAGHVKAFADNVRQAFDTFKGGSAAAAEGQTNKLASATGSLHDGGAKLVGILKSVGTWVKNAAVAVAQGIGSVWTTMKDWMGGVDKFQLVSVLDYIFSAYMLVTIRKFIKDFQGYVSSFAGMGSSIKGSFDQLTGTLKTMQSGVKAKIILDIAIAVGILAASLWVLSKIPLARLVPALGALAAMFWLLNAAMKPLSEMVKEDGFKAANLIAMAAAMTLVGFAMIEFATAVAILGNLDLATLAKGLFGIAVGIKIMTTAMQGMDDLKGVLRAAAAMVIMSLALEMMAGVIITFAAIDLGTFANGLVKMGAALAVLVIAMNAMPTEKMLGNSVGMMAVAASMMILAGALKMFASMSLGDIAKSLITMSLALAILAGTLEILQSELPGAMAMVAVAASMVVLAKALQMMGSMDLGSIGKALLAMAGALTIFLLAGAVAMVVGPGLIMLGTAVALLGAGMLMAGVGMAAFGAGLAVLVGLGTAAFGVIGAAISAFLALLPAIAMQFAAAVVTFMETLASATPRIVNAFVKIVSGMIDGANRLLPKLFGLFNNFLGRLLHSVDVNAPKFGHTFQVLLNTGLTVLQNSIPRMVNTGLNIITALLNAISRKAPQMATLATGIVVKFINAVSNHIGAVISAGTNLIVKFITGIGNAASRIVDAAGRTILRFLNAVDASVRRYSGDIGAAGRQIAYDLVDGLTGGLLSSGIDRVRSAAASLANAIPGPIRKMLGIASPSKLMIEYGGYVGQGLANGLTASHKVVSASAAGMANATILSAQKALDIHSPSRVFYGLGIYVASGFINGLNDSVKNVAAAGAQMAKVAVDTVSKTVAAAQLKADSMAAKAEAYKYAASLARASSHNKKLSKARRAHYAKEASALSRSSAAAKKQADSYQKTADADAKKVEDKRAYDAADDQGKADILNKRAEDAAASAESYRKRALQLSKEADLIRSKDRKRAAALAKEANDAMHKAESAALSAQSNAQKAAEFVTKIVLASSGAVRKDLDDWLAQEEADKAYAAMSASEQSAEMQRRSAEDQKKSDDYIASAREKLAEAEKLSKTNADEAKKLVDAAAEDVAAAKAAKDKADQEAQDAKQGSDTTSSSGTDNSGSFTMPDTTISSAMVFGAQTMFDAYAKALSATATAAAEDKAPIQFNQYNTSPEALSPSEIYRQSKNLLSDVERKLAGAL